MAGGRRRVLISGAGIAGATLAGLLGRSGHDVTVVERDQGGRSSGNPVDVRHAAYDVVEQLGILERLQERATRVRRLVFVDAAGRRVASLRTRRSERELEVPRSDLCAALVQAARGSVDFRFDDTVTGLEPEDSGVAVAFQRARPERFDLVVGADGLHSTVRRLTFGPEADFVKPLGIFIGTVEAPGALGRDDTVVMHSQPGAAIALHPGAGQAGAAFLFRSSRPVNPRDGRAAGDLLGHVYASMGWRAPELLDHFRAADDRYFDAVSRVRVPVWHRGRVVLLGDAASCVSLFGEGSSAAVVGAATLARAFDDHPQDTSGALLQYQRVHEATVRRGQRGAVVAARLLIPATRTGITLRDRALRATGHR